MKLSSFFLAAVFVALSARAVAGAIDFFDLPDTIVVPKSLAATPPPTTPAATPAPPPPATPAPVAVVVVDRRATPAPTPDSDFFKTVKGILDAPEKISTEVHPPKMMQREHGERDGGGGKGRDRKRREKD